MKQSAKQLLSWVMVFLILLCALPAVGEETVLPTQESAVLQYGDTGERVTALQEALKKLSYYTIRITGNYLEYTQDAVMAFQADYGLAATGIADDQTLSLLETARYRALSYQQSGDDVKALQQRLFDLGYYTGQISGNYLDGTRAAVGSFQQKMGLEVTYKADIATLETLFSDRAASLYTPTPVPTQTPAPTPTPEGMTPAPVPTVKYNGVSVSRGSTGNNVKKVQQQLTELGYFTGPINGNFYDLTKAAVVAFQQNNGLTDDGVVGASTWNAMFNDPDVAAAGDPPRQQPDPTPIPYSLVVDVNNQVVTVYGLDEAGEYSEIVKQMICSTGTVGYPTPTGSFTMSGRKALWAYFDKWGGYARFWSQVNANFAFHSACYNKEGDNMSLSVSSYKHLGSRASHGCIRLTVADAIWIYYNCGVGTPVLVTEDLPSDQELAKSLKPGALNYANMLPYETATPSPSPVYDASAVPPQPFRNLSTGDSGEDVYWLQMTLKNAGYYTGTVTGSYYSGTVAAVKAFQRANGLTADGVAGKNTQKVLYADVLATPSPSPSPTLDPTQTPQPVSLTLTPEETPVS